MQLDPIAVYVGAIHWRAVDCNHRTNQKSEFVVFGNAVVEVQEVSATNIHGLPVYFRRPAHLAEREIPVCYPNVDISFQGLAGVHPKSHRQGHQRAEPIDTGKRKNSIGLTPSEIPCLQDNTRS